MYFFQKHYNYIFVYILISRYILNFKCSLKCTQVFTFILVDPIGLTLEIFVKFLKLFLLRYTYCQRHFKQNFEVTFVPDKEMGVYEHKIQYIAKKCFKPKHTPSRCVFFRAIDFPRLEGIMHPTISYHSGSH